jgi:hypothetical protein
MRRELSARRIFFPVTGPTDDYPKIDKPRINSSQVFILSSIERI